MALTFRGGVYFEEEALAATSPIREMPAPELITLPVPNAKEIKVQAGERVLKGQNIAGSEESTPVFAPVSGKVDAIRICHTTTGRKPCVVIKNDFQEELFPQLTPFDTPIRNAKSEPLLKHFREKGLVDVGIDGAPLWKKLSDAKGKASRIIIRCVESDPAFAVNRRLLLDKTEEVLGGIKIMMRATGIEKTVFALDETQEDVADALLKRVRISKNFVIAVLKHKYPQNDDPQLIRALLKKEIPADGDACSVSAVLVSPESCRLTYHAFVSGLPPVTRVITVSGNCVKTPSNLLVPMGTSLRSVLEFCGISRKPEKLLAGGMMKGRLLLSLNRPVTETEKGLLAIASKPRKKALSPCIRCGRCADACPMRLLPSELCKSVEKRDWNSALFYDIHQCTDCGCCSHVCPAQIQLRQKIRIGKTLLTKMNSGKGGEQ